MNMKLSLTLAAITTLVAPAAMAATITVDDFDIIGNVISASHGNPASNAFAGAGILGGERYMWASTDSVAAAGTSFEVVAGSGVVSFTNGSDITGQAVLVYDGAGTGVSTEAFKFNSVPAGPEFPDANTALIPVNTTGLGGVNLMVSGSLATSAFAFDVNSFDAMADVDFRAYAWDMNGNVATYFENLFNPTNLDIVTFDTSLGLDEFTFGAGFDWTNIGALAFSVESNSFEFDGTLGAISVVPLPASALLLLGGLGGLTAASRRRRKDRKA
nr:VPLPA-CTERM sorting domain-containing protein [uncultured Roseovarius sp.]